MPEKIELYVIYKHNTNPRIRNYYRTYSKILIEVIKTVKKLYFKKLIKHITNKPKTLWKLVKPEINKQKLTDNFPPFLEGKLFNDHQELANMFNEYFIKVATNKSVDNTSNNPTAINKLFQFIRKPSHKYKWLQLPQKKLKT